MNLRCLVWLVAAAATAQWPIPTQADESTFPRAAVQFPSGQQAQVEFHAAGDIALLTLRAPDGSVLPLRQISDVRDALAVLGDPRLSFAWRAMLEWAGNDLTLLRERALARSRMAADAGIIGSRPIGSEQWTGDAALSAVLHYARNLVASGQRNAAIALLKNRLAQAPHDAAHSYSRVFLTTRLANIMFDGGQTSEAISLLETAMEDRTIDAEPALNLSVNLALALARSGASQRALIEINSAWTQFDSHTLEGEDSVKIPSSRLLKKSIFER